jgi:hypothetical protein
MLIPVVKQKQLRDEQVRAIYCQTADKADGNKVIFNSCKNVEEHSLGI